MNKELRIYRMTDKIMHYAKGKVDYDVELKKATYYCARSKRRLFQRTHVNDDSAAWTIASRLMKEVKLPKLTDNVIPAEKKRHYLDMVFKEMERRGCAKEDIPRVINKTGFMAALDEYPKEQLHYSIEDAVNEILLVAAMNCSVSDNSVDLLNVKRPTREQQVLFRAVNRELEKRAKGLLNDDERYLIVAAFVSNYDFSNTAIAHKSGGGWAQMILSEIEAE